MALFPHLDELQFKVFGHLEGFANSENVSDDIFGGVTQLPKMGKNLRRGRWGCINNQKGFF